MKEKNSNFIELQKKYENIESILEKLRLENMKKTNEILKLKKDLEIFRKKENNTSSEFPLPDEFKYRWETLVQTMLMDTFDIIAQNNILLMRTINIILKNIMQITKMKINEKIMDILSYLGLKNINEIQIKNFFKKFKFSLFQDYFIYLFFNNN
jgi:ribosomal protein L30/L7E